MISRSIDSLVFIQNEVEAISRKNNVKLVVQGNCPNIQTNRELNV
jgi:hypothetical protein